MKYILAISLVFFLSACPKDKPIDQQSPTPTPTVSPTPTATPSGLTKGPLTIQGTKFVDRDGHEVYLQGAIICCEDAKTHHWPFVSAPMMDKFADNKVNFTHIRLGPFDSQSEGPAFAAYKMVGNKLDLTDWNPAFWNLLRNVVAYAQSVGIYIEIDLIDAWIMERPEFQAWSSLNNVNSIDEGGCDMMRSAPRKIHEQWVRKVIQETAKYDNVLYEIGNETFDCNGTVTPEWEINIARIARNEMTKLGYGRRLIGTNSHKSSIEDHFEIDYIERHSKDVLANNRGKPVMVNEYESDSIVNIEAEGFAQKIRDARTRGTSYHLWRGNLNDAEFDKYLRKIRDLSP